LTKYEVGFAAIMTFVTVALGGWDKLLYVFITFIVLDYITGILSAISQGKLSSQIGLQGIIKKIMLLCLVWVATCLDSFIAPGSPWIRTVVLYFIIANEGLSIIENISLAGVPVPDFIKKVLLQVQDQAETKSGEGL
jgi:toxin secretion/phage lysis holin